MRSYWFLLAIQVLCGIALFVDVSVAESDVTPRPNVLLIIADDLGVGDVGSFYPSTRNHTPRIDQLASQGMRFTRFYTESTCSASRAALLTGQFPARLGFHPVARGISSEILTMPDWFHQRGYSTHHIGKWHIGEVSRQAGPLFQGFDTSFGFMNQWFLQGPDATGLPVLKSPVYDNPWLVGEDSEWKSYQGYLPDIITQHAVKKIDSLKIQKAPWFMWYATPLPHAPIHLPPGFSVEQYVTEDQRYQAMVAQLDKNIGELLDAVNASGQRENTVVIFLSDNGAPEKRFASNGAFSGGKGSYAEGGIRAPMIWVDPATITPASVDERAVSIMDIFPTLAGRVDASSSLEVDGLDIASLGQIQQFQNRVLYWLSRDAYSVLASDKHWRLSQGWLRQAVTDRHWFRILDDNTQDKTLFRGFYFLKIRELATSVHEWMASVSKTEVIFDHDVEGVKTISGNDFLRTPLKEWDFYIAFVPEVNGASEQNHTEQSHTEQSIAEQKGVWSVVYRPSNNNLHLSMHGGEWDIPVQLTRECTVLGVNADIYDRYTNVATTIRPSIVSISIDGKEIARKNWQINALLDVDVSVRTVLGGSKAGHWQGKLSNPVFYHRAGGIAEWPLLIDKKKLRTELCAQLLDSPV